MAKVTDLSPKFALKTAAQELTVPFVAGELPMGQSAGGLSLFSDSFKRGYGDQTFGSDSNGIWLGAADYDKAPFKVGMNGQIEITGDNESSVFNQNGFIFYKNGTPVGVFGTFDI